jgi:hypothetical protein
MTARLARKNQKNEAPSNKLHHNESLKMYIYMMHFEVYSSLKPVEKARLCGVVAEFEIERPKERYEYSETRKDR